MNFIPQRKFIDAPAVGLESLFAVESVVFSESQLITEDGHLGILVRYLFGLNTARASHWVDSKRTTTPRRNLEGVIGGWASETH